MFNVVVGKILVHPKELFAFSEEDWETNEKRYTLFTNERSLPRILKEAGIVKSTGEVRKNKPELCIELNNLDFLEIKWGKKKIYIAIGE